MRPLKNKHIIIDKDMFIEYYNNFDIIDIIPFDNNKILISYVDNKFLDEDDINNNFYNISLPISAAITSYSRVYMYKFKEIKNSKIFYSDTDSYVTNKPLDNKCIGTDLGLMKLEFISKKAVFLAPKVYGFIELKNKKEIIKIKGSKNIISFEDLSQLLYKNNKIEIYQSK